MTFLRVLADPLSPAAAPVERAEAAEQGGFLSDACAGAGDEYN